MFLLRCLPLLFLLLKLSVILLQQLHLLQLRHQRLSHFCSLRELSSCFTQHLAQLLMRQPRQRHVLVFRLAAAVFTVAVSERWQRGREPCGWITRVR